MAESISPEYVKTLESPASGYLCKLSENTSKLDFLEFKIQDALSGRAFYTVRRDPDASEIPDDIPPAVEDTIRHVRYILSSSLLECKKVKTTLKFSVGDEVVSELRLIERHYFKGELAREYDMVYGGCDANSTNIWQAEYDMPEYTQEQIAEFVDCPEGHHSDSFYFINGKLAVHTKASFSYTEGSTVGMAGLEPFPGGGGISVPGSGVPSTCSAGAVDGSEGAAGDDVLEGQNVADALAERLEKMPGEGD